MKTISASDVRSDIERVLHSAQTEKIIVTRAGKPSAVIIGIESYDAEDRALAGSAEFWRMIEQRRSGRSIPLSEIQRRLKARERKQRVSPAGKGNRRGS